jgi:hypothetical protein
MVHNSRATETRTGIALLAVLGSAVIAAAVDTAENYGFVHLIPDGWELVAMSYLLVGLVTAAPMMFIRPATAVVPVLATLLAVPAFFCGDLTYVVISSIRHQVSFDFADYMLSYAEFQRPYTVGLELFAPLSAGLLSGLRFSRLRVAAGPRGRHAAAGNQDRQERFYHADVD